MGREGGLGQRGRRGRGGVRRGAELERGLGAGDVDSASDQPEWLGKGT